MSILNEHQRKKAIRALYINYVPTMPRKSLLPRKETWCISQKKIQRKTFAGAALVPHQLEIKFDNISSGLVNLSLVKVDCIVF